MPPLKKKKHNYCNYLALCDLMCLISPSRSVFDVLEFRNKSAALIMSTLQFDINNSQQRTQRSMQTHTTHVTARKKQMEDTKVKKRKRKKKNVFLNNSLLIHDFCVKYCEIRDKL